MDTNRVPEEDQAMLYTPDGRRWAIVDCRIPKAGETYFHRNNWWQSEHDGTLERHILKELPPEGWGIEHFGDDPWPPEYEDTTGETHRRPVAIDLADLDANERAHIRAFASGLLRAVQKGGGQAMQLTTVKYGGITYVPLDQVIELVEAAAEDAQQNYDTAEKDGDPLTVIAFYDGARNRINDLATQLKESIDHE